MADFTTQTIIVAGTAFGAALTGATIASVSFLYLAKKFFENIRRDIIETKVEKLPIEDLEKTVEDLKENLDNKVESNDYEVGKDG